MDVVHPRSFEPPQLRERPMMTQSMTPHSVVAEISARKQSPNLDELIHRFLENVKLRYGENSYEVQTINSVLETFESGTITKRNAFSSINLTLGNQQDLKQDLMDVLNHKESEWSDGDFDFDEIVTLSSPQFLQPAHEPQMRLPSMIPPWYSNAQQIPSINPALINNFSGLNPLFQESGAMNAQNTDWPPLIQVPSSPVAHLPHHLHFSNHSAPPMIREPHMPFNFPRSVYDTQMNPFYHQDQFQESWDRPSFADFWPSTEHDGLQAQAQSYANNQIYSPVASYGNLQSQLTSPKKGISSGSSPSVLGNPLAVPIGHPAIDMPPPPTPIKSSSRRSSIQMKYESDFTDGETEVAKPSTASPEVQTEPHGTHMLTNNQFETPRSRTVGGSFIHSLCGKGFSSRGKVKKHHWGVKNDDIHTKTGCWAKHKKPNVNWDDHPSCKVGASGARISKRAAHNPLVERGDLDQKAPMIPTMLPAYATTPIASTSQTCSHVMAERPQFRSGAENVQSYHSHRLPTRNNFDSLLTAVNIASRIDAPKPQGRNDLVISYLNAQAVAAEQKSPRIQSGAVGGAIHEKADVHYTSPSNTTTGLGADDLNKERRIPFGARLPPQANGDENNHPISTKYEHQSSEHVLSLPQYEPVLAKSAASIETETKQRAA